MASKARRFWFGYVLSPLGVSLSLVCLSLFILCFVWFVISSAVFSTFDFREGLCTAGLVGWLGFVRGSQGIVFYFWLIESRKL